MFSIVVALFCLASVANGFPIVDCGSQFGNFSQVAISGCDSASDVCVLHKGQNASIEIDFTTNENATGLKAVVHGTVLIVPVPFHLPHPDACTDPDSGITCPLTKGQSYKYKAVLPVKDNYPTVSVKIRWELQDQDGKDIVCLMVPAKIR